MQEVGMMMTLTDEASWPGYNETIDIFFQKGTGRPEWIGREACANTHWVFLILMSYNSKPAGVLFFFFCFWFLCVFLCLKQSNALTPSWRPWKVCAENFGMGRVLGGAAGRKEKRKKKKTSGYIIISFFRTNLLVLTPHIYPHTHSPPHINHICKVL